ncbi:hypothetical protein PIB30_033402 [Stylosanthes scabra]|uniref:F-box domain-containing protein n=1 Tax=Stylosanthes scabra TaxID=79078 RepID=A0ABU6RCL3_9FABA|nr:hypothetical protein [Stylosanthes scabra]
MKKKKQRRNPKPQNEPQNGDNISALSDELLLHILSFLPAATAVATSLLSHRWRHLWDNLLVSYFDFDDGHRQIDFIKLVKGAINRRKEPYVRKLHLLSPSTTVNHIQNQIATCIDAALGPHLQEISLTLSSPCFFPRGILSSAQLGSLPALLKTKIVTAMIIGTFIDENPLTIYIIKVLLPKELFKALTPSLVPALALEPAAANAPASPKKREKKKKQKAIDAPADEETALVDSPSNAVDESTEGVAALLGLTVPAT